MTIAAAGNPVYQWQLGQTGQYVYIDPEGAILNNALTNPNPSRIFIPTAPEPLAAFTYGVVEWQDIPNLSAGNMPTYAIARSGNVYLLNYNTNAGSGVNPWSFTPAGYVGFAGVLAVISPDHIINPVAFYNPPPDYQMAPVVVGAGGKAATQVGQDPTTFMTYWQSLLLTPDPAGDDLVAILP